VKNIVKISNLSKKFRNVEALKGVNIELKQGEIHGANGSGKSTLLNILFGNSIIKDTCGYSGEILIDGQVTNISSPSSAIKCGIGMIHQEFALMSQMNVAENIKINRENVYDLTEKILLMLIKRKILKMQKTY
jgi:simple sugar transport system ATP-binding protein